MKGSSRAGDLDRVDVALDEKRRLLEIRPGLEVGERAKPNFPAFVGGADRLDAEELRPLLSAAMENLG